eukprot:CAMPEP_0181305426 /NCGR_PEP_ID=MMETSP1101-20121128/9723_1 /TAXON_ID=46948 /ORGANISM="Rhodomonas abbreviata, Strain Caron Lab Isolate" /LENGTH=517 /DNA_ID=CAMNT_0023411341 /DNA_START=156 /DNA_END=1709 /DNA_ORIENTATION=+
MRPSECKFHDCEVRTRPDFWQIDRSRLEFQTAIAQDNNVSEVWKASLFDPQTERMQDVAVKFFPLEECGASCQKIQNEMNVLFLASTRCDHVCKAYGWSVDEKGVSIIMKAYASSVCTTLREHATTGLPLPVVQQYGKQLCSALIGLHDQGIVMADLKPSNFLIDEFDNVVISDFGISTIQNTALDRAEDGVYGTFNYMSPEAFDSETFGKLSAKSDSWSFACCIIEMVTGSMPWHGKAMSAICFKVTQTNEQPAIPAQLPKTVRDALQRCLSRDPAERPSFREMLQVFDSWEHLASSMHRSNNGTDAVRELPSRRSFAADTHVLLEEKEQMKGTIKNLREKLFSCQEVSRILREQLYVVVGTLKEQQENSKRVNCAACAENAMARAEVEVQLKQCAKQKEVAKKMLMQENERSKRLAQELEMLSSSSRRHPATVNVKPPRLPSATAPSLPAHIRLNIEPDTMSNPLDDISGADPLLALLSSGDLRRSDLESQASTPALLSARSIESFDWGALSVPS